MSNIPNKIVLRAQQMGYSAPYNHFVMMLNPKYQGSAWDWNNFVNMAVKMTEVACW